MDDLLCGFRAAVDDALAHGSGRVHTVAELGMMLDGFAQLDRTLPKRHATLPIFARSLVDAVTSVIRSLFLVLLSYRETLKLLTLASS